MISSDQSTSDAYQPVEHIGFVASIQRAVYRARWSTLSIALTYAVALIVGMVMAHAGNSVALNQRDAIVSEARTGDTLVALQQNQRLRASLLDFSGNLFLGAIPNTIQGIAVIMPYPFVAYRGWVGGIVSVDSAHRSRLADPQEAVYYLVTLVLQLIPYTLAGGAGVHLGISSLRAPGYYRRNARLLTLSRDALADVLRIYVLIVPLFLIASLWEFLAR
jgi:hypothetical protein